MGEVIANAPTASNKARAGLSKEESTRFFGPPPIIAGEDQAQYEAMRDQISAAVGPLDFLEEIWVYDIVNLVWETLRLRRLRAALLHSSTRQRLSKLITTSPDPSRAGKLVINWASHTTFTATRRRIFEIPRQCCREGFRALKHRLASGEALAANASRSRAALRRWYHVEREIQFEFPLPIRGGKLGSRFSMKGVGADFYVCPLRHEQY